MSNRTSSNGVHSGPRPLWQLLLAEQTGQLDSLDCHEYQALLNFLGDLVIDEKYSSSEVPDRVKHYLLQLQDCDPAG